ncbi:MAG: VanW family protein [Christensenellales bacterium]
MGSSRYNTENRIRQTPKGEAYTKARRTKKKNTVDKRLLILGFFAVAIVAALIFLVVLQGGKSDIVLAEYETLAKTEKIYDGVTINGVSVGGKTVAQAKEAIADSILQKEESIIRLSFRLDNNVYDMPVSQITFISNTDDILKQALMLGREGSTSRQNQVIKELTEKGMALETTHTVDESAFKASLQTYVSQSLNIAPKDATVEVNKEVMPATLTVIESAQGRTVDFEPLYQAALAQFESKEYSPIDATYQLVEPAVTTDVIEANTKLIGYPTDTYFKSAAGSAPNRVFNIKKIAGILNGSVIQPGEIFSVNDTVGPRTEAGGWALAPGMEDGGYTEQAGGGVCQVSTTLFVAALKAELKIEDRRHHSWPVSYVSPGMDATISTGGPDLKIMNNKEYPVYILINVDETLKQVHIEIYGTPLEGNKKIKITAKTIEELPPEDEPVITVSDTMAPGTRFIVKQRRNSLKTETYKTYYDENDKKIGEPIMIFDDTYKAFRGEYLDGPPLAGAEPSATPVIVESPGMTLKPTPTPTPTPSPTPSPAEPTMSPTSTP